MYIKHMEFVRKNFSIKLKALRRSPAQSIVGDLYAKTAEFHDWIR